MINKKLIISLSALIILAFALNFINAEVNITFPAHYAIINSDGTTIYYNTTLNTQQISNYSALVYNCNYKDCTTPTTVLGTFNTSIINPSNITITFPTLTNNATYAIYFYKQGYIGWEQIINNIPANLNGSFNGTQVFFAKKQIGYAPIMNLTVLNEVSPNTPIEIGVNVSIDGDTYSAITSSGPLSFNPVSLAAYRQVETLIKLEILNSSGSVINTASTSVNISYSGYIPIKFIYSGFNSTGDYSIKVSTNVSDSKIITSNTQYATANIKVINSGLTNYTYSIINNLQMTPVLPNLGDLLRISFNYLSGYINDSGNYLPANTATNITIYNSTGIIYNYFSILNSSGTYYFNYTINQSGSYRILVVGTANDSRGNSTIPMSQEITFVVGTPQTFNPGNNGGSNKGGSQEVKSGESTRGPYGDSFLLNSPGNVISLTSKQESKSDYRLILFWIILLILLLLILIVLVYIFRYI